MKCIRIFHIPLTKHSILLYQQILFYSVQFGILNFIKFLITSEGIVMQLWRHVYLSCIILRHYLSLPKTIGFDSRFLTWIWIFINDNKLFVAVWRSGFSSTGHEAFMPYITLTDWHGKLDRLRADVFYLNVSPGMWISLVLSGDEYLRWCQPVSYTHLRAHET